ncbi:uncharacterized protein BJ212DRAFT_107105 [Suillus subaureus]|uniref:Uncharacterized protein n=1 Tax=Suillus subaureus TaxID=48587 RepID=A0A9P7EEA7_9AGAM|nr:uncharacterized protein BJ212DRAFT_107105 [Suillus subaureus]KAG1818736.1 hypothetical protein BJ212DRAFT_107105 [Suillus subaureus]
MPCQSEFMAPTTRVSNRDKHPGYILRPGAYSAKKTTAKMAAIDKVVQVKQEMDEGDTWEGEGEPRPPAPSNAKAAHPSGTHARNELVNSEQGQKAAAKNREPHEYKHMLKKQPTLQELVADTKRQYRFDIEEDGNEEEPELAQHGKRKQRVVYSASTDDERSTSKKFKRDECISQPVGRVEVLLPKWHTIIARDVAKLHLKQTFESHETRPKETKGELLFILLTKLCYIKQASSQRKQTMLITGIMMTKTRLLRRTRMRNQTSSTGTAPTGIRHPKFPSVCTQMTYGTRP